MVMESEDFAYIQSFIKNHAAIELAIGKEYLVESRLAPIATEYGKRSLSDLILELKERPGSSLKQRIIDAMTTNETLFFRDMHPFELLKNSVLPQLIKNRSHEKKLVIWCAAASSGQEPYSIAMILNELKDCLHDWSIKFIASDISEKILLRAKKGVYSQLEVNRGLSLAYLLKYFDKEGAEWRIKPELRSMIEYQQINIVKEWPLPYADIVFMRNVLIYFNADTKKEIFKRLAQIIPPDGYLFLGGSETMLGIDNDFERMSVDRVPCYQLKK